MRIEATEPADRYADIRSPHHHRRAGCRVESVTPDEMVVTREAWDERLKEGLLGIYSEGTSYADDGAETSERNGTA